MSQTAKRKWLRYGGVVVVILAAYFINVEVQTYWGDKAREATGLQEMPLDQALLQSKASGQPILANLSAVWCPTCRMLEESIFSDPEINAYVRQNYIFTRLEYESEAGQSFSKKYGLTGFPHVLILDGQGRVLRPLPMLFDDEIYLHNLNLENTVIESLDQAKTGP